MKKRLFAFATVALIGTVIPASGLAQQPAAQRNSATASNQRGSGDELPRFDSRVPSSARATRMSAAEIRQARALYKARQRTARLEYNLWMGYEPLRPRWNAVPMMSSRYPNRQVHVPIYLYSR